MTAEFMALIYFTLCLGAGALSTLQAGVNSQLRTYVGVNWTVLTSLVVSTIVALAVLALSRSAVPNAQTLAGAPPWIWCGGIFGVIFVLAGAVLAPRLGAGTFAAALITGQLLCALVLDQFGILGFPKHPLNWGRALGVLLLSAGIFLIRRS